MPVQSFSWSTVEFEREIHLPITETLFLPQDTLNPKFEDSCEKEMRNSATAKHLPNYLRGCMKSQFFTMLLLNTWCDCLEAHWAFDWIPQPPSLILGS